MSLNEKLLKYVQNGLGERFKIFAEAGERDSVRTSEFEMRAREDILNAVYGTLYIEPSNLAPIKGLTVLTIRATLEVLCEIRRKPTSPDVTFEEIDTIRSILDAFAQEHNGTVFSSDSYPSEDSEASEKTYSIVPSFSPAICGDVEEIVSEFGEVIPVYLSILFTAVEDGVLSNDVEISIDGNPIYFESATISRVKVVDQFTYGKGAPMKASVTQHGFGIDIVSPLLSDKLGAIIMSEILDGSFNRTHTVTVTKGDTTKSYTCIFGNSSLSLQPGKNVGATLSLVEARDDLPADE